jgi:hypothetical protein
MGILLLAMTVALAILQLTGGFRASFLGVRVRAQNGQFVPGSHPEKELGRIAQENGLHEAARANGGTYGYDINISGRGRARSVQQLVDLTSLIIVGTIQAAEPQERPHARIETVYSVRVSETVKGDARSVVKVRVPGGRLTFPDGTVAEIRTPGVALRTGNAYVLFLEPAPVGVNTDPTDVAEGVQVLNLGHESVVDVSTERTRASAGPQDPIRVQQDGRNVAEFLNELRALAHRGR